MLSGSPLPQADTGVDAPGQTVTPPTPAASGPAHARGASGAADSLRHAATEAVDSSLHAASAAADSLRHAATEAVDSSLQAASGAVDSSLHAAAGAVDSSLHAAAGAAAGAVDSSVHAAAEARRWWGRHLHEMRWQAELARLMVDPIYYGRGVPRGDGRPVVLVPGFLAGDGSLVVMAEWLDRVGYHAHNSGIVFNVDCSNRVLQRLEARVERIVAREGRKAALIGHSRGGHFAKALAHRRPDLVCSVVSMGAGLDTPFDISLPTHHAVAAVRAVHARTTDRTARRGCMTSACTCEFNRHYGGPFPLDVPLTSIYSRGDGVVWWEACVVPYARCVEVTGSHVGLAFNRKAYRAVAEALADCSSDE